MLAILILREHETLLRQLIFLLLLLILALMFTFAIVTERLHSLILDWFSTAPLSNESTTPRVTDVVWSGVPRLAQMMMSTIIRDHIHRVLAVINSSTRLAALFLLVFFVTALLRVRLLFRAYAPIVSIIQLLPSQYHLLVRLQLLLLLLLR